MSASWLAAALVIGFSASGGSAVVSPTGEAITIECRRGETPFAMAPSTPEGLTLTFADGEKRVLHKPVAVCIRADRPDDPVLKDALMAASVPAEETPAPPPARADRP